MLKYCDLFFFPIRPLTILIGTIGTVTTAMEDIDTIKTFYFFHQWGNQGSPLREGNESFYQRWSQHQDCENEKMNPNPLHGGYY